MNHYSILVISEDSSTIYLSAYHNKNIHSNYYCRWDPDDNTMNMH